VRPPLVDGAAPDGLEQLELAVAPDQRCGTERTIRRRGGRLDREPRLDRLGLPFGATAASGS
jgi:hypothetical protein